MTVVNALGLHARAAARFVHHAGQFKSQIKITRGSRTVDGKSILGLLLLAAPRGTASNNSPRMLLPSTVRDPRVILIWLLN